MESRERSANVAHKEKEQTKDPVMNFGLTQRKDWAKGTRTECIIKLPQSQRDLADHHLSSDFSRWPQEAVNAVISGEEQVGSLR